MVMLLDFCAGCCDYYYFVVLCLVHSHGIFYAFESVVLTH